MSRFYALCLSISFLFAPTEAEVDPDPFLTMVQVIAGENLGLEYWEVTMREQITREEGLEILKHDQADLGHESTAEADIYSLPLQGDLNSLLKLILPKDPYAKAELIAMINDDRFDGKVEKQYEIVKFFLKEAYFSPNVRLFACIKLNSGDIIIENDFFRSLKELFQMEDSIVHTDRTGGLINYEIAYGNSPLFSDFLHVNGHSMNVHLVKRSAQNEEAAFFIGTPILLNEY